MSTVRNKSRMCLKGASVSQHTSVCAFFVRVCMRRRQGCFSSGRMCAHSCVLKRAHKIRMYAPAHTKEHQFPSARACFSVDGGITQAWCVRACVCMYVCTSLAAMSGTHLPRHQVVPVLIPWCSCSLTTQLAVFFVIFTIFEQVIATIVHSLAHTETNTAQHYTTKL